MAAKRLHPENLDRVTWPHRATSHHAGHLTAAADHRPKRIGVDIEHFPACRPIAGDLELRVADAQARPFGQLHNRHALDGDVLAQHARTDRHATPCELSHRLGIEDADLSLGPAGVAIALHAKIGYELSLGPR